MILAGAFSDALQDLKINITTESYWTRLNNWLGKTEVLVKELNIKAGVDVKLALRDNPSFRQRLALALSPRLGELREEVNNFFEAGFQAVRERRGQGTKVAFLFDSLEQIRGSLSNEQEVTRSIERLFSDHLKQLHFPYLHVVYTVPPWLKFLYPTEMLVLPCLQLWHNNKHRSHCAAGNDALRSLITKRFTQAGLERLFGPDPFSRAGRLMALRRPLSRSSAVAPRNRAASRFASRFRGRDRRRHSSREEQLPAHFAGRRRMAGRNRAGENDTA